MKFSTAYLALYNAAQACGWAAILVVLAIGVAQRETPEQLYDRAAPLTKLVQGAALLDTLHAAVGLVPSSPALSLMFWVGRGNALFAITEPIAALHSSWWAVVMLGAWAAAEVIRYPWYAATTLGACPGWLTWLRYTMFIPLFPVGTIAEMALMWTSLPELQSRRLYSLALPNPYNWAFDYHRFIQIVLLLYPLLWWQLYSSLLRARAKKLGGGSSKGGSSKGGSSSGTSGDGSRPPAADILRQETRTKLLKVQ
ncbi:hypothetical protein HXX76_004498 [Chlamydomonas incerta]|uniref:Very-long-chain (3R)-3-hydroxyacyl-CoA dehydratase n=1 Tax=Chlamydomonas incerta TaxID=51695 RepID=A0A835TIQ8_CHLIN|nr:hypothetical protein HXX76_004498 [Chlamydomonas incerta]|eukprot:KAG2439131.1 hypothetical protein HXX76_004498 [Chlamydomonas incerta]